MLLAMLIVGTALPVAAQAPPGAPAQPDVSIQTQLGAIPLAPPRSRAAPAMQRTVRLTQLDADKVPVGGVRELVCSETGCQKTIALLVDKVAQTFIAEIEFVGRGAYFTLQSRSVAIGQVVEFAKGRPGPTFLRQSDKSEIDAQVTFVMSAAASLRELEGVASAGSLASGNIYARKREPDVILRIEVLAPRRAR